ncbi:MAG TPA: TerB family tellurite resistance protein [Steroidobacter sp.]|jgi:uncharacterized tellurite resistance protein B-like protein|nr:TerB family tellurite resistance protein [Steroidobacter sp.]
MIDRFAKIFGRDPPEAGVLSQREPLELATAALLIELSRSDFSESPAETALIRQLLQKRFSLSPSALEALIADAARRADRAVSLHEFTHRMNRELSESDKLGIVGMLWLVSRADGGIDKHEEHLIHRIAGLLHISDRDRVRMKLKVAAGG